MHGLRCHLPVCGARFSTHDLRTCQFPCSKRAVETMQLSRGRWGSPPLLGMRASPIHVGLCPTPSVWESASCSRCALHPASRASCCHPSAMDEWRSCSLCLEQVSVLRSSGEKCARSTAVAFKLEQTRPDACSTNVDLAYCERWD